MKFKAIEINDFDFSYSKLSFSALTENPLLLFAWLREAWKVKKMRVRVREQRDERERSFFFSLLTVWNQHKDWSLCTESWLSLAAPCFTLRKRRRNIHWSWFRNAFEGMKSWNSLRDFGWARLRSCGRDIFLSCIGKWDGLIVNFVNFIFN